MTAVRDQPHLLWLLRAYCKASQLDSKEIDDRISFAENKTLLTRRFGPLEKPPIYRKLVRIAKARRGTEIAKTTGSSERFARNLTTQNEYQVTVWFKVRAVSEEDAQIKVAVFCEELKKSLGSSFIEIVVEAEK